MEEDNRDGSIEKFFESAREYVRNNKELMDELAKIEDL